MSRNRQKLLRKGVVYTPQTIANELTRVALESCRGTPTRVLEPSVGEGAFLNSLVSTEISGLSITAIDTDEVVVGRVRDCFADIDAIHGDFLDYALQEQKITFDLVIGNPPFIKRADFSSGFRARLDEASVRVGFPAAEMKNSWAVFVILAADLIAESGVLALVLPQQFLTAHYGRAVQLHLAKKGFELDVFTPDSNGFPSIEQDVIALVARRTTDGFGTVRVSRVIEFRDLKPSASATVDMLESKAASIDIKSVLLDTDTTKILRRLQRDWPTIGDYCESAAGIVTAANRHLILREDEVKRLGLQPWVRRILQKSSYLPAGPVFSAEDAARLSHSVPCNLVDFCPEDSRPLSVQARRYIEECERRGIHERYKCQRRSPWYNVPIVPAGDGLFFKRTHAFPRFCVNEASILATDTAYQVRMINEYDVRDLCFSFYNSVTLLFAEIDGRSYFGGVLELTPVEFRGLPLKLVSPTQEEFVEFASSFSGTISSAEVICELTDRRLCRDLGISCTEMSQIKKALNTLRLHRRRHSIGNQEKIAGQTAS